MTEGPEGHLHCQKYTKYTEYTTQIKQRKKKECIRGCSAYIRRQACLGLII